MECDPVKMDRAREEPRAIPTGPAPPRPRAARSHLRRRRMSRALPAPTAQADLRTNRWRPSSWPVAQALGRRPPTRESGRFRMALKAQNQCRMTLETLATIENPPVVFARQANVTTGPQQIATVWRHLRAREKTKSRQTNYQGSEMSYYLTPEHRKLRAELIRQWAPWTKSTGPKSEAGKARVSRNAFKGASRELLRKLSHSLRDQDANRKRVIK